MTPADADTMIVNYLRETAPVATVAENPQGLSPELQASELEAGELFGNEETGATPGMGIIDTVGGSQADIGGAPVTPPGYDPNDVTPSGNAVSAAAQNREALFAELVAHPEAKNAAVDWDDLRSDDMLAWTELPPQVRMDWLASYIEAVEHKDNFGWDDATLLSVLENEQRDMARVDEGVYGDRDQQDAANVDGVLGRAEGSRAESGPRDGGEVGQIASSAEPYDPRVEDFDAEQGARLSVSEETTGSDASQIGNALRKLFLSPAKFNALVHVVQSVEQIPEDVRRSAKLSSGDLAPRANRLYPPGVERRVFRGDDATRRQSNDLPYAQH